MAEKDPRTHLVETLQDVHVCMLTTTEQDGTVVSRPMALQRVDDDGTLWFITRSTSDVAAEAAQRPVNVTVQQKGFWASVAGTAAVVRDDARKREVWNGATEAYFGEGADPEDPQIVLVRVDADSAEYWDSPGAVATAVETLRAKVSGGEARPGENETVEF